jgi:hypothetical protein
MEKLPRDIAILEEVKEEVLQRAERYDLAEARHSMWYQRGIAQGIRFAMREVERENLQ